MTLNHNFDPSPALHFFASELRPGDLVLAIGLDEQTRARLEAETTSRAAGLLVVVEAAAAAASAPERVHLVERLADAPIDLLVAQAEAFAGRVFLWIRDANDLAGVLTQATRTQQSGRLAALVWSCRREPQRGEVVSADALMLDVLGTLGFTHLHLGVDEQGAVLVPFGTVDGETLIFSLAASVLAEQEQVEEPEIAARRPDSPAELQRARELMERARRLEAAGKIAEAVAALQSAVAEAPGFSSAPLNLGVLLHRCGKHDAACAAFLQAAELSPADARPWNNLGAALAALSRHEEAVVAYRRAIELDPDFYGALLNLALSLDELRRHAETIEPLRHAATLRPDDVEVHTRLGGQLLRLFRTGEAVAALETAVALAPDNARVLGNLAIAHFRRENFDEAMALCQRAIAIEPIPEVLNTLGNCHREQGRPGEALEVYRRALEAGPDRHRIHSNLLLTLHYPSGLSPEEISAEHRAWDRRHAAPVAAQSLHVNSRIAERRLRVGYYSPDLRVHSVAFFLDAVLRGHDRAHVEVFCYADYPHVDRMTAQLRQHAHHWRQVHHLTDAALCDLVQEDRIDVLVDLAGHTAEARPLVFARRPAPVQIAYLGYPDTTGLTAMDYRVTDALADPPGTTEHLHTERLLRLPGGFLCYTPPPIAGEVAPPPCLERGYVTFGSFNLLAKLSDETVRSWAALLHRIPTSRLLLKSASLSQPRAVDQVRARFAEHGVEAERLDLMGRLTVQADHFARYAEVDIALDPFPYHGTTTTCEALWMGVPVVTRAGAHHAARVGASILSAVGASGWVATSEAEYVDVAARLAADPLALAAFRRTARERLRASPLLDERRVARELEAAYHEAWQAWCARGRAEEPTAATRRAG